ncbi:P-loop containing nucleoside triphosphate hydrolases superfamily protein [Striga hermonthica]|uniref:P-loop containing nucleoside triphosphate hydrolases superfamily protein n=1 Tax=Striga hermonthica TaxID=68872 RepID=A0A9N7RKH8_STRHE|nr:P-loop containing nucleoside triphosphate hydrolases superfamily protein [Striga hermonthica]
MRKDKGVAAASPSKNQEDEEEEEHAQGEYYDHQNKIAIPFSTRNASSKYDFVKVKVWLGDNADHYYVLSRFLLSRMLTVTKIPNHVAIKIALELKKLLIDNSLLDVSQSDLEANLFKLMERRGYGEEYINRYKMMTRFHHQRVPLVILVCGTACVGKSTIATQLAQRLNLPNVLQVKPLFLLDISYIAPLTSSPVWARDFSSSEELITEFCRECRIVRKGLAGDLKKAMKDGKPIIIEGIHLDPSIYLMDEENKSSTTPQAKEEEKSPGRKIDGSSVENDRPPPCANQDSESSCPQIASSRETLHGVDFVSSDLKSMDFGDRKSECKGEMAKDAATTKPPIVNKAKSGPEPIIIPIILKMAEFDHKALLEEWLSTRSSEKYPIQDKDKLISNLKTIQDYLCSFKSQGYTVVNLSATAFPQTLDWLHNYLLQCIEQGTSSVSPSSSDQKLNVPK